MIGFEKNRKSVRIAKKCTIRWMGGCWRTYRVLQAVSLQGLRPKYRTIQTFGHLKYDQMSLCERHNDRLTDSDRRSEPELPESHLSADLSVF
jgi:hypothetical protein